MSAHFHRTVELYENMWEKNNSVQKCVELYGNLWKKLLCTEMCGIVRKSVKKTPTLYGNVWKSDLVEIWFELASQLDLNCSKKLLVKLKYKAKDNLVPN